jgi:Serine carboxypeptidase S28
LQKFNLKKKCIQQRYFISNATYVPGSPVFLHLAGEWEADPMEIEGTTLGDLANKLGAFTIDLEHRYFGKSWPVP